MKNNLKIIFTTSHCEVGNIVFLVFNIFVLDLLTT